MVQSYHGLFDLDLDPTFVVDEQVISSVVWEPHVASVLRYFIESGMRCADVGANMGLHTLEMALRVGAEGKVFAFEPNPVMAERLRKNLTLNPELADRVEVVVTALSDAPEELSIIDHRGNATLRPVGERGVDHQVCRAARLDDLALGKLDVLKIDVEGMEENVLRGAAKLLRDFHPVIVVETMMEFGEEKRRRLEALLLDYGYHLFGVDSSSSKLAPVAFPDLPSDSVAIHRSDIMRTTPILRDVALFRGTAQVGASATVVEAVAMYAAASDSNGILRLLLNGNVSDFYLQRADRLPADMLTAGKGPRFDLTISEANLACRWIEPDGAISCEVNACWESGERLQPIEMTSGPIMMG